MLTIKDLYVTIDKQNILNNVSLTIDKHKIACILGPSGIGKTTLIKTIGGLISPTGGNICYNNAPLDNKNINIGYASQDYALFPWYSVEKNILLPLILKNTPTHKVKYDDITTKLNIAHLLHRFPKDLSGGEKQRVALARAMILTPEILLLDEPFSAVDAVTKEGARKVFLDAWSTYKPISLFVTHDIEESLLLSHQLFILRENRVLSIENTARGKNKFDIEFKELYEHIHSYFGED